MEKAADTGTFWPLEKPVLCNALVNYTPAHRREDTDVGEAGPDKLKLNGHYCC